MKRRLGVLYGFMDVSKHMTWPMVVLSLLQSGGTALAASFLADIRITVT